MFNSWRPEAPIKMMHRLVVNDTGHKSTFQKRAYPLPLKDYFNGTDLQWLGDIRFDCLLQQVDNWVMIIQKSKETVSLGGLQAKNTTFWLITNQTATFAPDPFDRIMGLSSTLEEGTFFSNIVNQELPAMFSLYFTPKWVGYAEIPLGGIDHSKFNGPLTYIPLNTDGGDWELLSPSISVNGKTSPALNIN
ncbi:hypothetical protein M422DRAFT_243150 [Sphaerobolus stellatus SS14]|nr:hypothetical protein M422DRAFT_243150 [Sphaerobolus stellatus SS14]